MPPKRASTSAPTAAEASADSSMNSNGNGTLADADSGKKSNGLPRLTPARDLTLGGRGAASANRKVFVPNLNAARNKNTNVKTAKDFTQPRGGRGGRGTRGARGGAGATRGRGGNSTLIQTAGVFSEGAGEVNIRKFHSSDSTSYGRGSEETIVRKRKEDKSEDSLRRELGGGDIDDDDEDNSEDEGGANDGTDPNKTDIGLNPVRLTEGLWQSQQSKVKEEMASMSITKPDDSLTVEQKMEVMRVAAKPPSLEEPPGQFGRFPTSIGAFLDATHSQLFVMQLPNVLPCVTDEGEDETATKETAASGGASGAEQANSPAATSSSEANKSKQSILRQLEEGQIGKILRYRSGRVKLLLGDTHFDLNTGLESGFLQELMSISCNREQRSGDMINLGNIQAKLKATPDWVHLFEEQERLKRQQRQTAFSNTFPTTTTTSAGPT